MLMRYDPFREFERLTQQPSRAAARRPAMMPMDAYRRGDQLVTHFDLPGVDPDAIELTVEQNVMTVKAERSWPPAEGDEILVSEREEGSFSRQVFLGEGLDIDHLVARYAHGVLGADDRRAQAGRARQRKSRDRC
jgi:HSP20 family protein